jgi:magnesium chelatase subunit D
MPADLPDTVVDFACRLAVGVGAEGLRADLVLCRAAAAFAGWEGRSVARSADVERVAPLALGHRRRRRPFEPPVMSTPDLERALAAARQSFADAYPHPEPAAPPSPPPTAADAAAAFDAAAPGGSEGTALAGEAPTSTGDAPAGFAPLQATGEAMAGTPPPAGPAPVLPGAEDPDDEDLVAGTRTTAGHEPPEPPEAPPDDLDGTEDEDPVAAGTGQGDREAADDGGHDGSPSSGASAPDGGDDAGDIGRAADDQDDRDDRDDRDAPAPGEEGDHADRHDDSGTDTAAATPVPDAPTAAPDGAAPVQGDPDGGRGPGAAPTSPPGGPWQSLSGGAFNAPPTALGEAAPPAFDPGPAPRDRLDAPVRTVEPHASGDARTATESATAGVVLADAAGRAAAQWRQDGVDVAAAAATEAAAPASGSARSRAVGRTVVVAVDASGSSGTHKRVEAATGAVLGLLGDAYLRRDRVAMVTFRGDTAEVVLPPTASLEMARARLAELPTGGLTPLAEGINASLALARRAESDGWPPLLVLVTDGRATGNQSAPERAGSGGAEVAAAQVDVMVIDAQDGSNGAGQAGRLAEAMGGRCLRLDDLTPAAVEAAVRDALR